MSEFMFFLRKGLLVKNELVLTKFSSKRNVIYFMNLASLE